MRVHLALLLLAGLAPARPAAAQEGGVAPAVEREVERIAGAGALWPGFDPLAVPLAVYDGRQTWLFRHPSPPAGFTAVEGPGGARVRAGRFEAVTANSSAEIGGVMSATLLADGSRAATPPAELAAVAIHEAFHVFQRGAHPGWVGNEGDLLIYPVTDADLLALRRLESAALGRALANAEDAGAACWARVAMDQRRERFARLDSAFVAYERLTELNEGLAAYLQLRTAGRRMVEIPGDEFLPEAVRYRAYTIGPALALLLDRLAPGWKEALERDDSQSLDALLAAAVSRAAAPSSPPCGFTAVEVGAANRDARIDAGGVEDGWRSRQRTFDAKEGWRVLIESAKGKPLWPQGFDPLNIDRVDGGLVHTRFLKLGNDAGSMIALEEEGVDIEARTEGVGPHPMFNGVAWAEVVLSIKPAVQRTTGVLRIYGPGFSAEFRDATLIESGRQLLVQLH